MAGFLGGAGGIALGAALIIVLAAAALIAVFTSRQLARASLFNRFFVLVAAASGFFSAVSSAIGFSLITAQETRDFFRNAILPPAFGAFVFFLSLATWVGGAELVRQRDWFRGVAPGLRADLLFFLERALKLFVVVPLLSIVLFVVSTWTTVVGLGGVDAVRHVYAGEIKRLQTDCTALVAWRGRDLVVRDELGLAAKQAARAAGAEAESGVQTGAVGSGAVTRYLGAVSKWYGDVADAVAAIVADQDAAEISPRRPGLCEAEARNLSARLASDPYTNYKGWDRGFAQDFDAFAAALDGWRRDKRIETLLSTQLAAYDRANPKPVLASPAQRAAIDRFDGDVKSSLKKLLGELRDRKGLPPAPSPSAAEIAPERGLDALLKWFRSKPKTDAGAEPPKAKAKPRTAAIIEAERIAPLSTISPRDAVILHADVFSDVWALGIAWDYAAYLLMLAYLFFPSAERAAGFKDET